MTTVVVVAAVAPQAVEVVDMFGNRGGDDWMANEAVKLGVVVDSEWSLGDPWEEERAAVGRNFAGNEIREVVV